ncbi:transmembrane protein 17B-like isoform X1 [Argonauta hians]
MASNVETTLRKTVSTMTDFLFPVSQENIKRNQHNILRSGHEYVTNLPFQMEIYFNAWFFPFWLVSAISALSVKFHTLIIVHKILLVAAHIMFTIIELIRLYLGYVGNLMERVPELAGSWLLTLLMQFPLILYLLFNDAPTFPLEIAIHIVMFIFVLLEIFSGYFAIRTMINYQMTQFHLRQFSDLEFIGQD